MFHIHFGALHRINCRICGCVRAMAPLCRSLQPVMLLCGQEHEFTASMPGNFNRLASHFVPEQAEIALEPSGEQHAGHCG